MKMVILWAAGAIVVIAAGFGVYQVVIKDDTTGEVNTADVQTGEEAEAGATKTACDIYTDDIAKQVLGESAQKSDLPTASQASTDDVSVTNCAYEVEGPGLTDFQSANVLVRGGKTSSGKDSNKFGFENNKTMEGIGTVTEISGIGDAAYYSTGFEQVNVLVQDGTYWLIVQGETRQQTEQLAKLLAEKL
jgi:hypothetical protein